MTSQEWTDFRIMLAELRQFRLEVNSQFDDVRDRLGGVEDRLTDHIESPTPAQSVSNAIKLDTRKAFVVALSSVAVLAMAGAGWLVDKFHLP